MLSQEEEELGLGRGELAIGQRALLVQRSQRLEFGRNPRVLRWRRHDGRVAWSWRAEPVWVMAPRVRSAMQARRVRVSTPMAARHGRVRVPVPLVPRHFLPDGRGRVARDEAVLPLRRRIGPEPVINRSVARPQRGGSG